ncbi:CDP-glycerol glycerophosphotransferase family protein [Robertmurraya sp. 2P01SA]
MKKIILFGASKLGELAFKQLKKQFEIVGFIDNDPNKQGSLFLDKEVFGIEVLKSIKDSQIIISSLYDVEIVKQLTDYGVMKFGVFELISENYFIKYYDYSEFSTFEIIQGKVCLLIENNSGSNTLALSKNRDPEIERKIEIVTIDKSQKSHNYYFDILTSEVILTTHDFRCNDNQINIQLWHGIPLKGLSYMSHYENQNTEANHLAWSKFDHIISSSQTYSTLLNACYGIDGNKYEVLGMPRNDMLFNQYVCKENLNRLFKREFGGKRILFYLPTFRGTIYGEKNGFLTSENDLFEDENLMRLNAFLKKNNIILITKPHPQEEREVIELSNIFFVKEKQLAGEKLDLYEILGAADVLITDYSSVYFDYLLLDRPIIFYTPDYDEYVNERGLLLEPFDFWAPGEKCRSPEQLQECIHRVFKNDNFTRARKQISNIMHRYRDNQSSRRVWRFIGNILN